MTIPAKKYLREIQFAELLLWDVKRLFLSKSKYSHQIVKLGDIFSVAKMEWIEIENDKEYPILGVRGQGQGVYINRIAKGKELTMRKYQKSKAFHLFYCKVRTVGGQWGIVYPEFEDSYGSSNMQYLKIDLNKILPEYFEMLLKIKKITNKWDTNAVGADGRHFPLKTLLNIEIPLPSLPEQNAIVQAYNAKIESAKEAEVKAVRLEREIEEYLMEELGIETIEKDLKKKGLQEVRLKNLERWDVWNKDFSINSNCFDSIKIEESILKIKGNIGKIQKNEYLESGKIPVVSQENNLISGFTNKKVSVILEENLPVIIFGDHSKTVKFIDFQFVCGADGVRILRPKKEFLPEFYFYYISFITYYIKTTQVYTRHWKYLSEMPIPLPPLPVQQKIVQKISSMKDEIKSLKALAEQSRKEAIENFEGEIFAV
ncbi:MAG: restriction endonuclease subunit S [Candidatus Peregrinibacteria bacterium]